jgi:arylformamidase
MNIIAITVPLGPNTPLYPGDPAPETTLLSSLAKGDALTASKLDLGVHIGTHVDFPAHFVSGGKVLGDYPIGRFVGRAFVLDLTDVEGPITLERIARERPPREQHVLIKTRNSPYLSQAAFHDSYVHLDPSAARFLIDTQPQSVGIDYYSLDPSDSTTFPSHRLCAEADVPVFVCIDLSKVSPGSYWFAGLPIAFPSLEGAPVRAILWRD